MTPIFNEVLWRPIPRFLENYKANVLGEVINLKTGKKLKPEHTRKGYLRYTLHKDGLPCRKFAHRVVVETFWDIIPGCPDPFKSNGLVVNHKNGVKTDNHISNLELVTCRENELHSYKVLNKMAKRTDFGVNSKYAKLNEKDIQELYDHLKSGGTATGFAKKKNVTHACINRIMNNTSWKHLKIDFSSVKTTELQKRKGVKWPVKYLKQKTI